MKGKNHTGAEDAEQSDPPEPNEKSYMLRDKKPSMASHRGYRIAAPDGDWGWYVVGGCAFANFLLPGMLGSFASDVLEDFTEIRELRYDDRDDYRMACRWIPATFDVTFSIAGTLSCLLCELKSHRIVTFWGGLLAFAGMISSAFANSIPYLFLSYGVMVGFGAGLCYPAGILIVNQYFDKQRGLANGLSLAGTAIGCLVMPTYIKFLATSYGYRGAILIASGMMLNVVACAITYEPVDEHLRFVMAADKPSPINGQATRTGARDGRPDVDYYAVVSQLSSPSTSTTTTPSSTMQLDARAPLAAVCKPLAAHHAFALSRVARKPELFALSAVYVVAHLAYATFAEVCRPRTIATAQLVTAANVAGRVLVPAVTDFLPWRCASSSVFLNCAVLVAGGLVAVTLAATSGGRGTSAALVQLCLVVALSVVAGATVGLEPVVAARTLGVRWLPATCSAAVLTQGAAQLVVHLFADRLRPLAAVIYNVGGAGLITTAVLCTAAFLLKRHYDAKHSCRYVRTV